MKKVILVNLILQASASCYTSKRAYQYPESDINITTGISYSTAMNEAKDQAHSMEELVLDIYTGPNTASTLTRPCLVMLHGGGYGTDNGDTSDDLEPQFNTRMAQFGFVSVCADWRGEGEYATTHAGHELDKLTDPSEDLYNAVGYMQTHASGWHVDADKVMVGGDSSGAFISMWAAYTPEGLAKASGASHGIKGVVCVSGGIYNRDGAGYTPAEIFGTGGSYTGSTPLQMVHGVQDHVVPWADANAVCAAARGYAHLGNDKVRCLYLPNGGHVPYAPHDGVICPGGHLLTGSDTRHRNYMIRLMGFFSSSDVLDLSDAHCPTGGHRRLAEDIFV